MYVFIQPYLDLIIEDCDGEYLSIVTSELLHFAHSYKRLSRTSPGYLPLLK